MNRHPFDIRGPEAPLDDNVTALGDHIPFVLAYCSLSLMDSAQLRRMMQRAAELLGERSR